MKIFAKIRFYYGAFIISFISAVIMVPLMFLFKNRRSEILHYYNNIIILFLGGKIKTHGKRDNLADMFVMNHQGIIDIIAMEASENTDLRWVAKKELFDAPWFGYLLKLPNMIEVDRENKSGLIKLIRDAQETKDTNRIISIFPEGTRTDKQQLLKFKGGTRIIAEKLNLSIQPIIITNSKLLLNEHNKTAHSSTVHISYLDTFKVDSENNKDWYLKLQNKMQKKIDEEYTKYERER